MCWSLRRIAKPWFKTWLKWIFFYPGDLIVAELIGTPAGNFLELRPSDFGGGWSFTLSLVSWLLAFVCLAVVAEWSKELESRKLKEQSMTTTGSEPGANAS